MKKYLIAIATLFTCVAAQANNVSPVGYWRTIDDVSKKPKAIVEISLNEQKQLQGRIVQVFQEPGKTPQTICEKCPGDKKDQPLVGLVFMEGLTQTSNNPTHWQGGSILDPKTGKVYRCKLDQDATANKLNVRGYLGFSLLGRTQIWEHVDSSNLEIKK